FGWCSTSSIVAARGSPRLDGRSSRERSEFCKADSAVRLRAAPDGRPAPSQRQSLSLGRKGRTMAVYIENYDQLRDKMVEQQIAARGVRSDRVLAAMRKVRREGYVPSYLGEFAYEDSPLPIEEEQTISQPYIVA